MSTILLTLYQPGQDAPFTPLVAIPIPVPEGIEENAYRRLVIHALDTKYYDVGFEAPISPTENRTSNGVML